MKTRSSKPVQFLSVLCLAVWVTAPRASAQTPADLTIQTYAGLTITGTVGTVYSIEHITDLAQTNTPSAWRCLEYLQLPASPYLWADKSAPATGQRSSTHPDSPTYSTTGRSPWLFASSTQAQAWVQLSK